jgi:ribosomal protein S18 acetylase RimI-like enzyme
MGKDAHVAQRMRSHSPWIIRPASYEDLEPIQDVERSAGQRFAGIGMAEIAADPPPRLSDLQGSCDAGLAWVAAEAGSPLVAYLVAEPVDGGLHIEQVSVHPDYARRGIGRSLMEQAAVEAVSRGLRSLTLTTFAEVPWNAPYYATCGFSILAEREWTQGLRAIRDRESSLGLDRWPRVCMRRELLLDSPPIP